MKNKKAPDMVQKELVGDEKYVEKQLDEIISKMNIKQKYNLLYFLMGLYE